jgi:hypothetical protein
MRLVISLPTRGRPEQLTDTLRRSSANLVLPNTVVMVQIDSDDKATIDKVSNITVDPRWNFDVRTREDTVAAKWNRALSIPADVYLVSADDAPEITPGFDAKILDIAAKFPDGIGMVYGHMANASFSSMVAPTAKFVEKLGHIFPEYFPYWFVDHWTDDLAKLIGRLAFADVRTDQSKAGKTQELREPAWWATWFDAAYLMRRQIARQIIECSDFDMPSWQKDVLKANAPLIEHRSRWINDNVRFRAKELEGYSGLTLGDPRYQRVRQKAVAMVPRLLEGMSVDEAAAYKNALLPPTQVIGLRRAFA